jgi:putative endonuclease
MSYFVYLIVTKNKKNLLTSYVGYTNNLKKRLYLHNNSKGAKFTKGRFWKLAYSKRYKSKNIALKEEYKLKVDYNLRKKIKKRFKENENICTSSI